MAPVFARLGKQYRRQIEFVAVNAYDRPDIAKRFGVKATPTLILTRKGKALRRFYGNIPDDIQGGLRLLGLGACGAHDLGHIDLGNFHG